MSGQMKNRSSRFRRFILVLPSTFSQTMTASGVEVKASATVSGRDFAGLRYLRDKLGSRFKGGVVLYTGSHTLPFGERLAAVPLQGLWAGS